MDLSTISGLAIFAALVVIAVAKGELSGIFLNWHGLGIVLGGTFAASLINSPFSYIADAWKAALSLLRAPTYPRPASLLPMLVALSEQSQSLGVAVLRNVDRKAAQGFLAYCAEVALESNNPKKTRNVLEEEVRQAAVRDNELINVFRTAGVLSPMFGLLGTLLGIVNVLKNLTDPQQVGPSMALAITSAFYGILMANFICVPIAGKLRIRRMEEVQAKTLILETVIMILEEEVPLSVETKLQSLLGV